MIIGTEYPYPDVAVDNAVSNTRIEITSRNSKVKTENAI
jgi:hypothetical protein